MEVVVMVLFGELVLYILKTLLWVYIIYIELIVNVWICKI